MSKIKKIKVGDTTHDIERSSDQVYITEQTGTFSINPGVMTKFSLPLYGNVTITANGIEDSTVTNIYAMQFITDSAFTSIVWPTSWIISPDAPAIEAGKKYEVNVLNYYVLISVWEDA